ncbi:unnamed protein product [Blepharisma stoltei]|uniref:Kelch motif family protein n=1 Tax=Blepharisma stoltei TaxID=1481888 RepID=A0AAU9KAR6_9CILI|nr:unnamed protein product [Blepharisma stoltei]
MEAILCYRQDCNRRADFKCSCADPEVYICTFHFGEHISLTDSSISHKFTKLYEQANYETKGKVIDHIMNKIADLEAYKFEIIENAHKKIEDTRNDLERKLNLITDEIENLNNYALKILQIKDIPVENTEPVIEILKFSSKDLAEKIEEVVGRLSISNIEAIKDNEPFSQKNDEQPEININPFINKNALAESVLEKVKIQLWEISKLKKEIEEKNKAIEENAKQMEEIIQENEKLKNNMKTLVSAEELSKVEAELKENRIKGQFTIEAFNIEALQIISPLKNSQNVIITKLSDMKNYILELDIEETLGDHISMCQLPDMKIFFYGNYWEKKGFIKSSKVYSGITFILDLSSNQLEMLEKGFDCYESNCIYYNNKVYAFGGFNGQSLTIARKYNLEQNRWLDLCEMPEPSRRVSSAMFQKSILLCGYNHSTLYRYEIINKIYMPLGLSLKKDTNKVVFVGKERAYVIEFGSNIYESDFRDARKWHTLVRSHIPDSFTLISHRVLYGPSMFFFLSDTPIQSLFEFNLDSKELIDHGRLRLEKPRKDSE